jgi:hypothetical protein
MNASVQTNVETYELIIEYEPQRDEFVKTHVRVWRSRLWRQVISAAVALVSVALWASVLSNEARTPLFIIMALTAYSAATVFPRMRGQLRRHWANHPFSGAQTRVTLDGAGVRTDSWNGYGVTLWHGFTHYQETADAFLVFRGPRDVQILPKRAFTAEQIERCRGMLRSHIGRTKYVRPVQAFPVEVMPVAGKSS